jgi:poly(3-hydroxyalkanoate) synthetase
MLASLRSSGLPDAWPSSSADWQSLIDRMAQPNGANVPALGPDAALIHGIAAYRRHPWSRDIESPAAMWSEGETLLRDFGGGVTNGAAPVLLVPSLVNRASILDLSAARSMARHLAGAGLRVLLLDWGWPDAQARTLDLDALITGRLARAIDATIASTGAGERVTLVGYCMGGLLTTAAAQLLPDRIAGLALLATPWDFHAGVAAPSSIARMLDALEPVMAASGTLPVDLLQMMFGVADPHAVGNKYRAFGQTAQDSDRARQFVAIEDWLNDGVPLAAPVARQCLRDWYGDNAPAHGAWRVAGQTISPQNLRLPCFAAIPDRDRIVPPESALALASAIPGTTIVKPKAGHIGMVAGASAREALWAPLALWALGVPAHPPGFRKARRKAKLST